MKKRNILIVAVLLSVAASQAAIGYFSGSLAGASTQERASSRVMDEVSTPLVGEAPGTLDTTFDGDGKVTTPVGSSNDSGYSVAIQPDGKLLVAGTSFIGASLNFALARDIGQGATFPPPTPTPTPTPAPTLTPSAPAFSDPTGSRATAEAPLVQLYENGPLITHPAGGPPGSDASRVQNVSLGLVTLGFNASSAGAIRIADDFTVPAGGVTINTITLYGYQTGSTTTSTFNTARLQIWNGAPNAGGVVVFGDTTTNRFASTSFTNIYRDTETTEREIHRPIMATVANVNTTLAPGTYWLDFQLGGTLASIPFVPPVTILGQTGKPGANALRWTGTAWEALDDGLVGNQFQDVPFIIHGTVGGCGTSTPTPFDFDGDCRSDVSVYRPADGNWYLNRSTAGFGAIKWGNSTDTPVAGDFDGDGRTDTAIFRPSATAGTPDFWVLKSSDSTPVAVQWGLPGDLPLSGDYDGDGKTDFALFRPSDAVWYILNSGGSNSIIPFGLNGDVPMAFDLENDGRTNLAVFRPSENRWYIARNTGVPAQNFESMPFGLTGDKLVPADYDGDNRDDVAVYRPSIGQWIIRRSSDGVTTFTQFGIATDVPVPADYDYDGRDDIAIYRNGQWWLNRSTAGLAVVDFGLATDRPIPAKYIQ